jgi:hypothetical protein
MPFSDDVYKYFGEVVLYYIVSRQRHSRQNARKALPCYASLIKFAQLHCCRARLILIVYIFAFGIVKYDSFV